MQIQPKNTQYIFHWCLFSSCHFWKMFHQRHRLPNSWIPPIIKRPRIFPLTVTLIKFATLQKGFAQMPAYRHKKSGSVWRIHPFRKRFFCGVSSFAILSASFLLFRVVVPSFFRDNICSQRWMSLSVLRVGLFGTHSRTQNLGFYAEFQVSKVVAGINISRFNGKSYFRVIKYVWVASGCSGSCPMLIDMNTWRDKIQNISFQKCKVLFFGSTCQISWFCQLFLFLLRLPANIEWAQVHWRPRSRIN